MIKISIQQNDFSVADEYQQLIADDRSQGGVATFIGRVRNSDDIKVNENSIDSPVKKDICALELEYYPGMTEKVLTQLAETAREKWPLAAVTIIHRVGKLMAGEQIVFVGVTSMHRKAAFAACEYIMDILKTTAPFWKKEFSKENDQLQERWVEAKAADKAEAEKWLK
ncbi:MAG TPA: hypothetical protein ENJ60_02060 [Aeromonadales bacterium]|nr:hypothetical protein [Aeromonadales bacterium]